mmetsp:Transcript_96594/g.171752  ORF Transcript_96594/g.171752 Transcript_96594/m.171752 type:complete len:192 (-) Transcript_96594:114-689(-)|eukprot:CAMPEP_0197659360 /NCGR_PEP_ID=MMETSP1338-20131121/47405_1 /TAXON_ID=43686 ORGANISM="Pelagodinium beii, Strain RCC1491" /NCGR_SAMPLE_ID=MMETSP1338 /ASSEMBLY_ACC=CAM_ASM_000754 /LENGTH=191 /DNA_ID=CAMNT_0043236257 /DNA_START=59 /DNA_END=634 /DNA_ORIENTATION=+
MSSGQARSSGRLCLCAVLAFMASAGPAFLWNAPSNFDTSRRAAVAATLLASTRARAAGDWRQEWLDKKARQPGVKTLPDGLMYKVSKEGPAGGPSPLIDTRCTCTYYGLLPSGKLFDRGTIDFAPKTVIAGWAEAMMLMKEGDEWDLYIPAELAYGSQGVGDKIPPNAPLEFRLKIDKVGVPEQGFLGLFR